MAICLKRGADLHTAQLMPLPLTVPCFSKIQIGFTFLVPAHPGSPGQRVVKRVCVCVYDYSGVMYRVASCRWSSTGRHTAGLSSRRRHSRRKCRSCLGAGSRPPSVCTSTYCRRTTASPPSTWRHPAKTSSCTYPASSCECPAEACETTLGPLMQTAYWFLAASKGWIKLTTTTTTI